MILVTKEGKLVTIDFDAKYQPTQKEPVESKVADIGLGSSAVVQYTKEGEKNIATNIEYVPAKGEEGPVAASARPVRLGTEGDDKESQGCGRRPGAGGGWGKGAAMERAR